jgi:hypothetical protein
MKKSEPGRSPARIEFRRIKASEAFEGKREITPDDPKDLSARRHFRTKV